MPPAIALLNYMTIRKLYHFRGFSPKLGVFVGFSLCIIFIAERNSEAAMGRLRAGPVLRLKETGRAGD